VHAMEREDIATIFMFKGDCHWTMSVSQQTCLQVLDTLDMFARSWNRGDTSGIDAMIDTDCSVFWPGREDRACGKDALMHVLGEHGTSPWSLQLRDVAVQAVGTVAWVTASYRIELPEGKGGCRPYAGVFTGVLKGTGHAWVFAHIHFS